MTKLPMAQQKQLRVAITNVLGDPAFDAIPVDELATVAAEAIWTWAGKQPSADPNKGQPWTDATLRVVLREAPTHESIYRLARAFGRSVGAVEQIYRWAATPDRVIKQKRPDDAFIRQIKRIAKEVGWEAF